MLSDVLPQEAFAFLLVMTRLAAMVLYMPALGDKVVPQRVRLYLAFALSLFLTPLVSKHIPAIPASVVGLIFLIFMEFLVGVLLGLAARILSSVTHTAGTIIAFQTGLAAAQSFDPAQGTQSAVVSSLLNLVAVTMIFMTDTHHLMIMGFANSYLNFPVTGAIQIQDLAGIVLYFVSQAFRLGVQLAAPFLIYAFVFYFSMGMLARLIPQFQVFFIGLPLNIMLGFSLFTIILGSMMMFYLEHFQQLLLALIG